VVFSMFESATNLAGEVVTDVETFFSAARGTGAPWADARIFQTRIRRNIKLAECPSHGTTIFHYDRASNGAKDYQALAEEFGPAPEHTPAAATPAEPAVETTPAAAPADTKPEQPPAAPGSEPHP
jgi:chromosome partitioning protein